MVRIEHNRLQTLALAYTEGYVTNERLRYTLNIHKADIYDLLKDMCGKGYSQKKNGFFDKLEDIFQKDDFTKAQVVEAIIK